MAFWVWMQAGSLKKKHKNVKLTKHYFQTAKVQMKIFQLAADQDMYSHVPLDLGP